MYFETITQTYVDANKRQDCDGRIKLLKKVLADNDLLCDAYVLYLLLVVNKDKIPDREIYVNRIFYSYDINDEDKNMINMHLDNLIQKKSPDWDFYIDVRIIADMLSNLNITGDLSGINPEIVRCFILHQIADKSLVQTGIDEVLYNYMQLFTVSTYEFKQYVTTNRLEIFDIITEQVYMTGDLDLMSNMKFIRGYVNSWRI